MPALILSYRKELLTELQPGSYVWTDPRVVFPKDLWDEEVAPAINGMDTAEIYIELGSKIHSVCRLFIMNDSHSYNYNLTLNHNMVGKIQSLSGYLCLVDPLMFDILQTKNKLDKILKKSYAFCIDISQPTDINYVPDDYVTVGDQTVIFYNKLMRNLTKKYEDEEEDEYEEEFVGEFVKEFENDFERKLRLLPKKFNFDPFLDDLVPTDYMYMPYVDNDDGYIESGGDYKITLEQGGWTYPTFEIIFEERKSKIVIGSHRLNKEEDTLVTNQMNVWSHKKELFREMWDEDSDSEINGDANDHEDMPPLVYA